MLDRTYICRLLSLVLMRDDIIFVSYIHYSIVSATVRDSLVPTGVFRHFVLLT